jgi:two-component system, NarL family, response regulator
MTSNDPKRITVLTVDDHPLLREGVAAVLAFERDMMVVAEAADGREAVECYRKHRPDVTLMDLQMPKMKGLEAIMAIRHEFADARILVVTTYDGDVQALRAIKAGAAGYLLKNMLRKELPEAIRSVHAGRLRIPGEIATAMAEHMADDPLTEREVEVLRCVAAGNPNKEVAAQLSIAEETVKAHVSRILSKLRANDRTHAVVIGVKRGIIDV